MATSMAKVGSLSQAITIARDVIARYLAAWSAMSGDLETARWATQKLLAAQPDFTIEQYRSLPFFDTCRNGQIRWSKP
jgi:hypothetical protein